MADRFWPGLRLFAAGREWLDPEHVVLGLSRAAYTADGLYLFDPDPDRRAEVERLLREAKAPDAAVALVRDYFVFDTG